MCRPVGTKSNPVAVSEVTAILPRSGNPQVDVVGLPLYYSACTKLMAVGGLTLCLFPASNSAICTPTRSTHFQFCTISGMKNHQIILMKYMAVSAISVIWLLLKPISFWEIFFKNSGAEIALHLHSYEHFL